MKTKSTFKRIHLYWSLASLLAGLAAPARAVSFSDAAGEMELAAHEVSALRTDEAGSDLKITVVYGQALDLLDLNFGNVFIDGDRNPDTGVRLGADCLVEYIVSGGYATGFLMLNDRMITLGEEGTGVEVGTNSIAFYLPCSLWGGRADVRLFACSSWTLESTQYDRVPDAGWLDTASGLAVFPRPGNPEVCRVQTDSAADAVFPNLTELKADVGEGNLRLWLTFSHGIEEADLQAAGDILVVELGMDLDRRLWTGFRNNREDPPTFGLDREIKLMLSHLFSRPSGCLRRQVPPDAATPASYVLPQLSSIGLGGQSTDTRLVVGRSSRFGTAANQIFMSIPLGYLGYDEGGMYLTVSAFLETTLTAGHSDALPDSGAVDTTAGLPTAERIHPVADPAGAEIFGTDGTDDSLGFGLQGDEIISSHACALDSGALNITADLESLEISDLAFVNLFVDADGNTDTGIPLHNATLERMGADFYLSYRVAATPDPGLVTMLLVDLRTPSLFPQPRRVDALISLRFGGTVGSETAGARYSVSVPQELLGPVGGATARYVLTTTLQSYSTTDQEVVNPPEDWSGSADYGKTGVIKVDPAGVPTLLDTAPSSGFYHVAAPADLPLSLAAAVPNCGAPDGGTPLTLFGSGFDSAAEVFLDGTPLAAERVEFVSSGEIAAVTPSHAAGAVTVAVRNPDGSESVLPAAFTFRDAVIAPPEVRSVEPAVGAVGGGTAVQIQGINFTDGAVVRLNGLAAGAVSVLSPFLISAVTPPGQIGTADIEVENVNGGLGALADGYNYGSRPPLYWALYPNFGPLSGGTAVTIAGDGFESGVQAALNGVSIESLQRVSDRMLTGITPSGGTAGPADLTLSGADGSSRVVEGVFDYGGADPGNPAPSIFGVTPGSSPTEGGEEVTIPGTDFREGAAVLIDGYPVAIHYFSEGLLKVFSPPHASGLVPVEVVNPDGQSALLPADEEWNSFSYSSDQPNIWLVNPMSSPTVGGQEIVLHGSGFKSGATVDFDGVPGFDLDISSSMIFVTTPPHSPGTCSIKVTNPNGRSFTYQGDAIFGTFSFTGSPPPAPVISDVTPASGPITGGTRLTLSGSNLFAGIRVFFGSQEAAAAERLSTGSMWVDTPASVQTGTVDVIVRNADGQQHLLAGAYTFTASTPQVAGLTPDCGPTCGGTPAAVSGSGFMPGCEVALDGSRASEVVFVNEQTLSILTPPGFPGAAGLTVFNPGGVSGGLDPAFTYEGDAAPAPQVLAVLPSIGPVEGGTAVSVIGQGFLSGLSAGIGGTPLSNVQVESTGLITGTTPAGSAGAFDVGVTNRDGQASAKVQGFIYIDPAAPAPAIDSVAPTEGPASGGTDVVVSGRNFQPGARVYVDQSAMIRMEYISDRELRGQTTAGTAGAYPLFMWNPDGQTNLSSAVFRYADSVMLWLLNPACDGTIFYFSFQTQSNLSYSVQYKNDLTAPDWLFHATLSGDGSVLPFSVPADSTQRFYRVRQP